MWRSGGRVLAYAGPVGLVVILLRIAIAWPQLEPYWHWALSGCAFIIACWGFILKAAEQQRQRMENRPDLVGDVTGIAFLKPGQIQTRPVPPKGSKAVTFNMTVRNRGSAETTLVTCSFVLEGCSRQDGKGLYLHPQRMRIAGRDEVSISAKLIERDVEQYRNRDATLYLQDASGREYPVEVRGISPSMRGRKDYWSDFP